MSKQKTSVKKSKHTAQRPHINPEAQLTAYLAQMGMKLTNQRRLILHEFYHEDGHYSAEDLYQKVRLADPSIGQATVYRTLNLLCDAGLARELRFGNDVTIFEPTLAAAHHDHLICEECGNTVAVLDEKIEALQAELATRHGFKPTWHRMYLYGLCANCLSGKK